MGGVGYQSSAWSIEVRRGCHELPRGSFVVTALQVEPESAAKPRPASFILGRASLTLESAFRLQEPFEFEHQMAADGRQRTFRTGISNVATRCIAVPQRSAHSNASTTHLSTVIPPSATRTNTFRHRLARTFGPAQLKVLQLHHRGQQRQPKPQPLAQGLAHSVNVNPSINAPGVREPPKARSS
jgi:hypothetical protein